MKDGNIVPTGSTPNLYRWRDLSVLETNGYPCGCIYHVEGDVVVKVEFCSKHRVVSEVLLEGLA